MRTGMVEATDAETWDSIFSVNARGVVFHAELSRVFHREVSHL